MSTTPHTQAIDTINNLSAYGLASMADVASPDALGSPGAQFLTSVRDSLAEWVEYVLDTYDVQSLPETAQDNAFEQVDACVPVYTRQIWQTFVDLCAYHDESDGEFDGGTMTEKASYVLAHIAERLFVALAEEYVSAYVAAQDAALGFCDADDDEEYVSVCPACGAYIDYCQGHGDIGDPHGARVLEAHDDGIHDDCHPAAIYNGQCN